jgi:hypothetical protein
MAVLDLAFAACRPQEIELARAVQETRQAEAYPT